MLFLPKSKIFNALICDISTFKVLDYADFLTWHLSFPVLAADPENLNTKSGKKGDNHVGSFHKDCPNLIFSVKKEAQRAGRGT